MKCDCGQTTLIMETRFEASENMLRRRRMCPVCGTRFSTMEIAVPGTVKKLDPNKTKTLQRMARAPRTKIVLNREVMKKNAEARRQLEELRDTEMNDGYDA
jgi:transcriptional regulator NrdR family protein